MEFVELNRDKKRKRRRRNLTKKHRDQRKSEVTSKHKKLTTEPNGCKLVMKKNIVAMEANAFWENYKAAHEWQNRHNSTWWKTRCFALEHENNLLKESIRMLINNQESHKDLSNRYLCNQQNNFHLTDNRVEKNDDDNFEFQLNEDVMSFLAQSMRHKIELKIKQNMATLSQDEDIGSGKVDSNAISLVNRQNEGAKLLYGEATSRIVAMETALQATIEKHIDTSKPQYWPNIPLKL